MQDYHKLIVWQKSMEFVKTVYNISHNFPKEEMYGLTSQLKRSVSSIPANIAEGAGRKGNKEFLQFLYISCGSLNESRCHIEIAEILNYINE